MKIRIMGTEEELKVAKNYYSELSKENYVKSISISNFYPNRNSFNICRLYIDIEYTNEILLTYGEKNNENC